MVSKDMIREEACLEGYVRLGDEIVKQAVRDYRRQLRLEKKGLHFDATRNPLCSMEMIEKFFHSRLFATITSIDSDWLTNKLREEYR